MHGSPLKQFLFTLAAVIALGLLLFSATRPTNQEGRTVPSPESSPSSNSTEQISAFMVVKCAHKPEMLRISLADEKANGASREKSNTSLPLYQGTPDDLTIEEAIDLPNQSAVTIIVEASWPEGTPDTPISITIEPDGRHSRTATNWSIGKKLHNTYLFSW